MLDLHNRLIVLASTLTKFADYCDFMNLMLFWYYLIKKQVILVCLLSCCNYFDVHTCFGLWKLDYQIMFHDGNLQIKSYFIQSFSSFPRTYKANLTNTHLPKEWWFDQNFHKGRMLPWGLLKSIDCIIFKEMRWLKKNRQIIIN